VTIVRVPKGNNNLGIPQSKEEVRVKRRKLHEGRRSVRGEAISGGRSTLRRFEPRKGEGFGPGPSVRKSLKEERSREAHSRREGETFRRKRQAWSGAKLQGRSKPKMGASCLIDSKGAMRCDVIESVEPGGVVVGNCTHRMEGTHVGWITAKEHGTGNGSLSIRRNPLKA